DLTLYTILQIISVSLFEKVPIYQLLTGTENNNPEEWSPNQLNLWNF
ncbi:MAG TPA: IS4 family transposase, partial [Candidatus Marinimicrobia bacterium]|nr:IS4 family transposase [Candidatus Neomarinimicrobiota bacterium]